jgi:hypothetical protein
MWRPDEGNRADWISGDANRLERSPRLKNVAPGPTNGFIREEFLKITKYFTHHAAPNFLSFYVLLRDSAAN